ncbi:TipJ family phage tail tip protein [Neorhizobium petrolearium]|uniref:TipJ family phage tail tip protein n=1 Tax=Neorhizobium petrolearium TaxID=515361 RepID=UPI003F7E7FBB
MIAENGIIPVLAAPMIDAGRGRISAELPYGLSIAEIVERMVPDRAIGREYIRVALVTKHGSQIVPSAVWHRAYPHPGVHVIIRVVPGKDALRSILQIAVAIAAIAIGAYFAPALAGTLGIGATGWQGIISLGVTVLGNLLINALIPPPKPQDQEQQNRYSISGWKNRIEPDGAVPVVLGEIRYAPPFAAISYSEIVGDWLYIRSAFNFGYGRVALDDFRIGETSLSEYDEVEIEVREGVDGDAPLGLFPRQVLEESVGAELTRPYPRDDLGNIIPGSQPVETPVTRTTGADAASASVIFAWPSGLFSSNDKGELRDASVSVKIQQRLVNAEEWQDLTTIRVSARKREAFYRQHTWDFPSRGRWQVRCIMLTAENNDLQLSNRTSWAALQTIRPEYPLNFSEPLALVALRIKATHQLNGQLDNFNARCRRYCLDYDDESSNWIERPTRTPASLYRFALQSPANPRSVADAGIDIEQLEEWHDFCRLKVLKYDRVLDDAGMSLRDALAEIAAAGRATPRHDGRKWGVVVDRPADLLVIDDYSPRNSYGFKVSRSYYQRPDGMRVKFLDATNDHKPAERLVPWPGHTGEIKLTEALELPGKTDPDEIYREATRRMYEAIYRPDVYRVSQDGPLSAATRGDKVRLSADTIERTQVAGRVRWAKDWLVELDELVTMEAGESYAIRFRFFANEADATGLSVVRTLVTIPGETRALQLTGDGPLPAVGSIAAFGIAGQESFELIVSGIEAGEDFSQHLKLIDAAPIIDELIEDLEIPAWSGRVGAEIPENMTAPPEPRFTSISSGISGTDESGLVTYLLEPGSGPVQTAQYKIAHRLVGAPDWTIETIPAANGGGTIDDYQNGDNIQICAAAISPAAVEGPFTVPVPLIVGGNDSPIPTALDADMIEIGGLLGAAVVQFSTSADTATTQIQIYRSTAGIVNRETDAVGAPVLVEPSRSYSIPVGDTTRQSLVINGGFDNVSTWVLGAGWTNASGKATHAAGSGSAISQALAAQAGKFYRISFDLSDVTAGDLTPRLTGGSVRAGTARGANGSFTDRVQAVTGNNTIELLASSAFAGSVDNIVAYLETATCLAQGEHFFWLEPQNEDGVPGPMAGPFAVTIR